MTRPGTWPAAPAPTAPPSTRSIAASSAWCWTCARDDAREAVRRLAATSDILVENFRPGVMARLGLDYSTLAAETPRLVYASISGFGQTGPWAGKGGFDLVAQGVSGIMSVTGEPGRPPVKAGIPVTDLGAGLFALSGHPRRAALSRPDRPRAAHRHVAGRRGAGAVGLGGDGVLRRAWRAGPTRLGAPDERALSGRVL